MRVVPLNEVKNRLSMYLGLSRREDIVVTKNGRAAAVLHGITDEDVEDYLFESDPRFIARIESLRKQYRHQGHRASADGRAGNACSAGASPRGAPRWPDASCATLTAVGRLTQAWFQQPRGVGRFREWRN